MENIISDFKNIQRDLLNTHFHKRLGTKRIHAPLDQKNNLWKFCDTKDIYI